MICRVLVRFALILAALLMPALAGAAGGVVVAADPRAAEAGREILKQGGSAADAAMAMMLALSVVEPQSSGIGGGGFIVYHDARTGAVGTVDGREKAPASAGPKRFLRADGTAMPFIEAWPGGYSVGVPGNIRLMERTHARWGKLPWAALFAPAIKLADEGFDVTPRLNKAIAETSRYTKWSDFPEISALYLKDGAALPVGTHLRNPALAATLRMLAKDGPDAFYTGAIGEKISAAIATTSRNPTGLGIADLAAYQAKDRAAVCGRYRGYRICGMGPPSSGAVTDLQILGLLERFDMKALGPDSPQAWHLIGEAMQLAYADRAKYLGDPDFLTVPVTGLIDPAYLAQRSKLIAADHALGKYEAGTPPGAPKRTAAMPGERGGTTHFVAIDAAGNIATMTSTVESGFGSQLLAGGMVLNNELTDFTFAPEQDGAPVANRVEPGKRPLSSMSPVIVYDPKGKPVLALGSAGGKRIIMHVLKALVGVIDWGLPADQAIALPNIYYGANGLMVEQGTRLEAMIPALARFGQPVVAAELPSKLTILQRTANGWKGAADPRSEGVALTE